MQWVRTAGRRAVKRYRSRYLTISGPEQAKYGATVTFRNADGKTLTLQRTGGAIMAVIRALCDAALALDPTFRVICISTPSTIFGDLVGRDMREEDGAIRPEAAVLSRAGRKHMLAPELIGRFSPRSRARE